MVTKRRYTLKTVEHRHVKRTNDIALKRWGGNCKSTKSERCRRAASYMRYFSSRVVTVALLRGVANARPPFTAKRVPRPPSATRHNGCPVPVPAKNSDRPLEPYTHCARRNADAVGLLLARTPSPPPPRFLRFSARFEEDRARRMGARSVPTQSDPGSGWSRPRESAFRRCPREGSGPSTAAAAADLDK